MRLRYQEFIFMRSRLLPPLVLAALAIGLWVMPSVGTQGQGTLGDRYVHADRALFEADRHARRALDAGDAAARSAVSAL